MKKKTIGSAVAVVTLSLMALAQTPVAATPSPAATETIRKTLDDVFAVLKDKALTGKAHRAERIGALRKVVDRVFNWGEMARGSLGVQWRSLDPQRRARFVEVFKDVLAVQYMDDIDRFQGTEKVTVDKSAAEGEDVIVHTTLITASRDRIPMDYRLHAFDGKPMVIDLSIEGVSLVNHFRKTFSDALANMTIEQLIEKLRRQMPAPK